MCRALTYFGQQIPLDDLLYKPDNSLIKQAYDPLMMRYIQNLAGFGMALWDKNSFAPERPFLYRTPNLPFFDINLKRFSEKAHTDCLLAHVRGVGYSETELVLQQNAHPFLFPNHKLSLAHNGQLAMFNKMKFSLLPYIKHEYATNILGTTDSEWLYALLMSQLETPEDELDARKVTEAIFKTFDIIKKIRAEHKIAISSPANLFITNGEFLIVTRYVFDFGCYPVSYERAHLLYHSLWYTYGEKYGKYGDEYKMSGGDKKHSVIISSEPLTSDTTTWIEVPEYSLMIASKRDHNEININITDIFI